MSVLALVPAAGDGVRLGAGVPKALVRLGGVPLVVRAVDGLLASEAVQAIVVAVRAVDLAVVRELLAGRCGQIEVIVGGADRSSSVRAALWYGLHRFPATRTVLVHDAARALTPPGMIASLVAAVEAGWSAVVPVLPLADTVKELNPVGVVLGTVDRSVLRAVQTPQAFEVSLVRRAYGLAESDPGASAVTDDAGLVERLGEPVHTVPGDPLAFKITTPWDLRVAELVVGST
ncbi:MAG: 2-C-methyl-D-erythritol 4-phosphate cytidylyltransferase [Pseudonocardia sp.]|nr:2-C-methyl-D-erythritol 4-phosphate cytidylyltransferase [Pseudonocardia sp.]